MEKSNVTSRANHHLLLASLFLGFLVGCNDVPPSNPFDPITPSAQQAKGAVTGIVHLQRFSNAIRLQSVVLELVNLQNGSERSYQESPNGSGDFEFSDIPAGNYLLQASAVGFMSNQATVNIPIGLSVNVGVINLAHQSQTADSVWFRGQVLLDDQAFHGGTSVQLKSLQDNQSIIQLQTDADGWFNAQVSPNELLEVGVERNGYTVPNNDMLGQFRYLQDQDNFVDMEDNVLSITLSRAPIAGEIHIPIEVNPKWIPVEQRYARVNITKIDGGYQASIEAALDQATATFSDLPAGRYLINISRSGFKELTLPVITLDERQREVTTSPMIVELETLSEANIDLDGHSMDVCELRSHLVELDGGDFSGAKLSGYFGAITADAGCMYCTDPNGDEESCEALSMVGVNFTNAHFDTSDEVTHKASLRGALMSFANFFGAQMRNIDASEGEFSYANFFAFDGAEINFAEAQLQHANFTNAQLQKSHFAYSDGIHEESFEVNGQMITHPWSGLSIPLVPISDQPCLLPSSGTNLNNANFAQANLTEAYLVGVDLSKSILADAIIVRGDLRGSCLKNSSLNLTDISEAYLDQADLSGVMMINTVLYKTKIKGAKLDQATLTSAIIEQAIFTPLPIVSYGDQIDDRCAHLPIWEDYYPKVPFNPELPGDCDDNIDNDFDGYIDLDDPGCLADSMGHESKPACIVDEVRSPACSCRTSMIEANLNGANLVGARFDGADLSRSSLLGLTVGSSLEAPVDQPYECDPYITEVCINLCHIISAFSASNTCNPEDALPDGDIVPLLGMSCSTWSNRCLEDVLPIGNLISFQVMECLYSVFIENPENCSSFFSMNDSDDSNDPDDAIQNCFESNQGQMSNIRTVAHTPTCSFDLIRNTINKEARGESCDVTEADPQPWDCCPRNLVPLNCTQAKTSFANARLAETQMSGVNITDVILNDVDLSAANLNAARLSRSDMTGSILDRTSLRGVAMSKVNLSSASLRESDITQSILADVLLSNANLTGTIFDQAQLNNVNLSNSFKEDGGSSPQFVQTHIYGGSLQNDNGGGQLNNLFDLNLPDSNFESIRLENLSLGSGDLSGSSFVNAILSSVFFKRGINTDVPIKLMNVDFTRSLLAGVSFRGEKRVDCDEQLPKNCQDLKDLPTLARIEDGEFVQLSGSQFSYAFLRENELRRMDDAKTGFSSVNLSRARFSRAHFRNLRFSDSFLGDGILFDDVYGEEHIEWRNLYFSTGGLSGNLQGLNASSIIFNGFDLINLNLNYDSLSDLYFENLMWYRVNFNGQGAQGAFTRSELESLQMDDVNFRHTRLDNITFKDIVIRPLRSYFSHEEGLSCEIEDDCTIGECVFHSNDEEGNCRNRCATSNECGEDKVCLAGICIRPNTSQDVDELGEFNFEESLLSDITFEQIEQGNLTFTNTDLQDSLFEDIDVNHLNFNNSTLSNVVFEGINVEEFSLTEGQVWNVQFAYTIIDQNQACGSNLGQLHFSDINWQNSDLTGICNDDLAQHLSNQNLDEMQICDRHQGNIINLIGTPSWTPCPTIYCPDHVLCSP